MRKYDISLRPLHYACLSGGKDSLYMFGLILNNLDKYPLDFVVHYDLEINWEWSKKVIDFIEQKCLSIGIPFYRIKPTFSWLELYEKYDMPTRKCRWCNSYYKLDCERQLIRWIESLNCRPIAYIGFCSDEVKRFKYSIGENWKLGTYCYPLAEENIPESVVLEWAKTQPIFSDYYLYFRRQGCKLCPMLTLKEFAYLYKYEPDSFNFYFKCVDEWEHKYNKLYFSPYSIETIKERIIVKWLSILEYEENQISFL